ncbi:MAG: hydrogenase-4 component G [Thermodesulfobacteriota bacterium]|nr:hydrogenase-4 component G [Thermodesulfobacteriota bacterium]
MISTQTDWSLSSTITRRTFQISTEAKNTKKTINHTVNEFNFQFRTQTGTHTLLNLRTQNALSHFTELDEKDKASLVYNDTPISELSPEQASDLISDNGYFGIDKTAQRIIDFVVKGAGDDVDRLKAGREGILQGFAEAEKAWGGSLPQICYQTIEKSLDTIDEKIQELGGFVIDISA